MVQTVNYEQVSCNICGKPFMRNSKSYTIVCPECRGNRHKALNRIFTKDTVFLVCKWYDEGMEIYELAKLLDRSECSIIKALKEGKRIM